MKKNRLTTSQLKEYNEKGYLTPIDILSSEKIKETQKEIENIEKKWNLVRWITRNNNLRAKKVYYKVSNLTNWNVYELS